MTERDPHWDEMFDLQYDICDAIRTLLKERLDKYPPLWRAMVRCYVIEQLAESARFDVVLPAPPLLETEAAS